MRILFNYTTRSRRSNFLRGIESIVSNLTNKTDYHILISVENEFHDPNMYPLPQLTCNHTYCINTSAPTSKVDAINRDVNECGYEWDILINMSDDVVFTQKGFDEIIRKEFFEYNDQCLHFPDGNRKDLLTVSILGCEYYKRFNYIYHPEYKSLYCDNEAMEVAIIIGCYKFVDREIFNHLHPAYSKGRFDEQYQRTESYSAMDSETYHKRKSNGFS